MGGDIGFGAFPEGHELHGGCGLSTLTASELQGIDLVGELLPVCPGPGTSFQQVEGPGAASGESVLDKPAFRNAMRRRRCLIPADGFYDWRAGEPKRPYFVRAKSGTPLAFAGLWETWTVPNGEELDTTAIVTTRATRGLAAVHECMPVIVAPEAFDLWLDCAAVEAEASAALIAPAPEVLLEYYEVSPAVNRVANDSAELIAPATAAGAPGRKPVSAKPKKPDDQLSLLYGRAMGMTLGIRLIVYIP
jgi:putative SOS response-associated peptidase YedK